jgi:hypothetical protein
VDTLASDSRYERALQGIRLLAQHHVGQLVQAIITWRQAVNEDIKKNFSANNVVNVQGVCKRVSILHRQSNFAANTTASAAPAYTGCCDTANGSSAAAGPAVIVSAMVSCANGPQQVHISMSLSWEFAKVQSRLVSAAGLAEVSKHLQHLVIQAVALTGPCCSFVLVFFAAGHNGDPVLGGSHPSAL